MTSHEVLVTERGNVIKRGARGRVQDFAAFYGAEFGGIFRLVVMFCGDRDIALDSTQEAFVRAYERWGRLHNRSYARGWVVSTAFNRSKKLARKSSRVLPWGMESLEKTSSSEQRLDVLAAVRRLPYRQRQVILLYYLADQSVEQLADAMNISAGAVKKHLARARENLRNSSDIDSGRMGLESLGGRNV